MARKTKQQEIDELQEKLDRAYKLLMEANNREVELQETLESNFDKSVEKQRLERERLVYKEKYEREKRRNERLNTQLEEMKKLIDIMGKVKPAGRKPKNDAWQKQYQEFCELMDAVMGQEYIMEHMNISRATFFRLKKMWKEEREEK